VAWASTTKQKQGSKMVAVPSGCFCRRCLDLGIDVLGYDGAVSFEQAWRGQRKEEVKELVTDILKKMEAQPGGNKEDDACSKESIVQTLGVVVETSRQVHALNEVELKRELRLERLPAKVVSNHPSMQLPSLENPHVLEKCYVFAMESQPFRVATVKIVQGITKETGVLEKGASLSNDHPKVVMTGLQTSKDAMHAAHAAIAATATISEFEEQMGKKPRFRSDALRVATPSHGGNLQVEGDDAGETGSTVGPSCSQVGSAPRPSPAKTMTFKRLLSTRDDLGNSAKKHKEGDDSDLDDSASQVGSVAGQTDLMGKFSLGVGGVSHGGDHAQQNVALVFW
jgi:hypothetical protein